MTAPNFAAMLRQARKGAGLTAAELARRLGFPVTIYRIYHFENGTRRPREGLAVRLADALGASPEDFVGRLLQDQLDAAGVKMRVRVEMEKPE